MALNLKNKIKYLKKSYRYVRKYKTLVILIVALSFFGSIFEGFNISLIIPFLQTLSGGVDIASVIPAFKKVEFLFLADSQEEVVLRLISFLLVMVVLKSIFTYLRTIIANKVTNFVRRDLQNNLYFAVSDSSLRFYNSMRTGNLVGNISVYTDRIVGFIFVLFDAILQVCRIVVYGTLLLFVSWKFTLISVGFFALFLPLSKRALYELKRIGSHIARKVSELHSQMIEAFLRIRLVKIFCTEKYEKDKFNRFSTDLALLNHRGSRISNLFVPSIEILIVLMIFLITFFSIKFLKINFSIYLPLIVAYLFIFIKFFSESSVFIKSLSKAFSNIMFFNDYEELLEKTKRETMSNGSKIFSRLKKQIEFREVYFSHEKDSLVLNNVNFTIPEGSFTALVGSTGSGKTTVVNLIMGLFFIDKGSVLIDGDNIKDLEMKSWRKKIGYIPQDIVVFNDSVKNNIIYGKFDATVEEIERAARLAHIHEFVLSLPEKYDTILGERGAKLSGGQKQRIAIARALIHNPDILILDEATSSLDTETENKIQKSIEEASQNRTVIAIAHRLSTISRADNIIVIEGGKIVEQGTHEELLAREGYYKKLYKSQFN